MSSHAKRGGRGGRRWHHGRGGHGGYQRQKHCSQSQQQQHLETVDLNNPVLKAFVGYRTELDTRHDKYERILKVGRDVTIESKRTIFLLHRLTSESKEVVLREAEDKLSDVRQQLWTKISLELQGEDPYQFLRAFSPGLQEYIEAVAFCQYHRDGSLIELAKIQESLTFNKFDVEKRKREASESKETEKEHKAEKGDAEAPKKSPDSEPEEKKDDEKPKEDAEESSGEKPTEGSESTPAEESHDRGLMIHVYVPPMEYVLGLADLTGEIMRLTISTVGSGDLERLAQHCCFMRSMHDSFVMLGNASRDVARKLFTLKQSLTKVETALYTLRVRGSEIPKHMLADMLTDSSTGQRSYEEDDGTEA